MVLCCWFRHAADPRFVLNLHCDKQQNGGQVNLWSRNGHQSQAWSTGQNPQQQQYAQNMSNDLHHVQQSYGHGGSNIYGGGQATKVNVKGRKSHGGKKKHGHKHQGNINSWNDLHL